MKERPLIFSAVSIPRLLDGSKTQTRRLVKPQPDFLQIHEWRGRTIYDGEARWWCWKEHAFGDGIGEMVQFCPHGAPGDRIWVKEAWRTSSVIDDHTAAAMAKQCSRAGCEQPWTAIHYEADGARDNWDAIGFEDTTPGRLRSPLYMPRWASRITLELTEVRLQRLHEITEDDALAEGAVGTETRTPIEVYRQMWLSLHGPGSWAANPWVWALTFRRIP